jgi:hypothetical protein
MNTHEAIVAAANLIEDNPRKFKFDRTTVPQSERQRGCAIGWIAYFAGCRKHWLWGRYETDDIVERVLGVREGTFFRRLDKLHEFWCLEAPNCATALRAYAKKYHSPAVQPLPYAGIPKPVRAIFDVQPLAAEPTGNSNKGEDKCGS